ncbi:MAG: UDP-N-acetylmuramoyl-L-alanyl-D-glutamate--2,6-diaminopimelate ligase [Clostridia bacterium]|nr:UDP-N-acetylmuramoyl-L-alanyl-D-glutamate--2,6-diaminopimelate ligase [Clostridia bacterium]
MKLSDLIKRVKTVKIKNFCDFEVEELALSSKEIFKQSLFFAVKGNNFNGNDFIYEAVKRGAKAVVTEYESDIPVCQIIVKDVYLAVSSISYEFYKPKKRVKVIGVVGTNGKTTTTYVIKSVFDKAGIKSGVIGTLGAVYDGCYVEPSLTTPDAISLNETLYNMAERGVEYAIIELSAHAITQKRASAIKFEALVFTNCTRDHLDYYKTFAEYEKTKLSVFTEKNARFAVVNADDNTGKKIINSNKIKTFTYGLNNPSDVFAINVDLSARGVSFVMNLFDDVSSVDYSGAGTFNVYNCLAAATVTSVLGLNAQVINAGISSLTGVAGRMEYVESFRGADVFVDYAHTPDGLLNTLKALREITEKRLIVVFGCGGNRDKGKRPEMGKIAGTYADYTIITSDNPRFEEPYEIISQIESGLRTKTLNYITVQNRKMAINYALNILSSGDVLLVAGKGAEEYQDIMGVKTPFNDKLEVRDSIAKIKFGGEII